MRRAHLAALVGALAAGALTATFASGAGPQPKLITLKEGPERIVTAKASDGGDEVWVYGTAPGDLTFGADRQFTSMRTDCEVVGVVSTNAVCSDLDLETIEVSMGGGSDEVKFMPGFVSSLKRIIARGGDGEDRLRGSDYDDELAGGSGADTLRGRDGKDELNGGAQSDRCIGGAGKDRIEQCEN
jgi:hypothetical protein